MLQGHVKSKKTVSTEIMKNEEFKKKIKKKMKRKEKEREKMKEERKKERKDLGDFVFCNELLFHWKIPDQL